MDKLKPLIEHHFWILFFVVLLLPVIGWWPTASELSQQTESKISAINKAFSDVPAGSQANDSWSKNLNKIAERAEAQNHEQRLFLWERQWKMMTWPNTMLKEHLPQQYRDVINLTSRNVYKGDYDLQVEKVWLAADPFDAETGKGTVLLDLGAIPRATFNNLTPTSEELWDAQEDLWLLENLMKSIREANQGTTLVTDSVVRSLDLIELVGGPGNYPDAEPSSSGGSDSDVGTLGFGGDNEEEMAGMEGPYSGGGSGGGDGGFGAGRGKVSAGSVSFDPADEFGEELGRYIDFEEGAIYRKRGFYLEAIIDHERLPELLVALTNSSWPVTITRVQMAKVDSSGSRTMQGGGFPGANGSFDDGGEAMEFNESASPFDPGRGVGGGGLGVGGAGAARTSRTRTGKFAELARAAVVGNNLAKVAISGVIYIYNPPEVLEGGEADAGLGETSDVEMIEQPEPETPAESAKPVDPNKQETPSKEEPATPAGAETETKKDKAESASEKPKPVEATKEAQGKPASEPPATSQ